MMDALIVLGLLIALALAAPRWGCDSSVGIDSKERELASHGASWNGRAG